MAKKKPDPYAAQAQANTLIRYGPEVSTLRQLLADAEENRDSLLRQAKLGRASAVDALDAAGPTVAQAYGGAQQAVQPAFAQQGGIEATALQARLGEASALAQTQLANRRVGAVEGEGAARSQALRDFASDRGKISLRATDLARESGAFAASQIGELSAADAKALADQNELDARLNQSERGSQYGAGLDPDTGLPIPGGRLDPKTKTKPNAGRGWATSVQQSAAGDEIQRLLAEATENKAAGEKRGEVADFLLHGAETSKKPVYDTVEIKDKNTGKVTGHKQVRRLNDDGTPVTQEVPGFDAAKSQLLASAALDMVYDGHLSRRNQKLLHARGIKLEPLGLVTYDEWRKKQRAAQKAGSRPVQTRAPVAPDSNGQMRPT